MALALLAGGCGGGADEGPSGTDGGGPGSGEPGAPPAARSAPLELAIEVRDGRGGARSAELLCRGEASTASGYLATDAEAACRAARRLLPLLEGDAEPERVCTQVYGGPQTARITGAIGDRLIDRRLARRDGCEIADWDRAAPLLGEQGPES